MKKKILVVCYGNIYRSPIASALINQQIKKSELQNKVECNSCGIQGSNNVPKPKFSNFSFYKDKYRILKPIFNKLKIDIDDHRSKPVTRKLVKSATIVIAMDKKTLKGSSGLQKQFPEYVSKMILFTSLYSSTDKNIADIAKISEEKKLKKVTNEIYKGVMEGFRNLLKKLETAA